MENTLATIAITLAAISVVLVFGYGTYILTKDIDKKLHQ
jgi:hypothetical protein